MTSREILLVGIIVTALALTPLIPAMPAIAQTAQDDNYGFIRFIHTAIDGPAIDIYAGDGEQAPLVQNLTYGQSTDFLILPSSTQGFLVRASDSGRSGSVLFRLSRRVKANQSEILAAAGLVNHRAFILEPFAIDRSTTHGKARVRIFNMVWGGPYLTIKTSQGVTLGQDMQYLSSTNDIDMEPGTYTFEIHTGGGKAVTNQENVKLSADQIYSMMILGGMDGNPPIHFVTLSADQETTRVRFVNKSGTAADIYVKGIDKVLVSGLAVDASTDFITLPSGAITFVLRAANSNPTVGSEIAFVAPQLRPSRDVTITINGAGAATQMGITEDHLTQGLSVSLPAATDSAATPVLMATAPATPPH